MKRAADRCVVLPTHHLDWQFAHVAGIDSYAIAIRIDQLEVVVTKQLVLSDCIHRQSLFH